MEMLDAKPASVDELPCVLLPRILPAELIFAGLSVLP